MKAYILNFLNRYKKYSENLDVKTAICNKSWWVFNDSGEKELYIFQEDYTLLISLSGRVTKGTWEYVSANHSLIITAQNESYMLHLAFMDNVLFAMQVDGTQKYSFMIDENNRTSFKPKTLNELQCYFEEKEQAKLLEERQRQNRLEWERQEAERQRQRRLEQEQREAEIQRQKREQRIYEEELKKEVREAWLNSGGREWEQKYRYIIYRKNNYYKRIISFIAFYIILFIIIVNIGDFLEPRLGTFLWMLIVFSCIFGVPILGYYSYRMFEKKHEKRELEYKMAKKRFIEKYMKEHEVCQKIYESFSKRLDYLL